MSWNILLIIHLAVLFHVSLMMGLSLVGSAPKKHFWKISLMSFVGSVVCDLSSVWTNMNIWNTAVCVFLLFTFMVRFYLKMPILQSVIAILLGTMYHLAVVYLTVYNAFDIVMVRNGLQHDQMLQAIMLIFIILTNIFVSILIFKKSPALFENDLFLFHERKSEQEILFLPHIWFSIIILTALDIFLFFTFQEKDHFTYSFRVFVTIWGLFMCGLVLYFLRKTLQHKLQQSKLYLDEQYKADMFSFFRVIRTQRHDFNFHLNAIYGMIQNGSYDECRAYIDDVASSAKQVNELLPLHHPAISAMLYTMKEAAQQKGMDMRFHILDNLSVNPCTIYETNKVLGNLLQNAMDELDVNQHPDRLIVMEIAKQREQIMIMVSNAVDMDEARMERLFASGFSTKAQHEGIGLAGIERIITSHRGIIYPELTGGRIKMHVQIPIQT